MTSKTETAERLSAYAQRVYRDWCGEPAYVEASRGGYQLREPSQNASPVWYATARECRAAIRQIECDDGR